MPIAFKGMKGSTFCVRNTKTGSTIPSCGWCVPVFLSIAAALLPLLLAATHARAMEPGFGQAAEEAAAKLAGAFPVVRGAVTGVEKDRVLIDLGAKQVYQGMELQVYREGDEVKHPVTGEVLGRRDKKLGLLRVTEVKERFSEAAIVAKEEGSAIRVKDLVRISADRLVVALPLIDAGGVKEANVHSVTKDLAIALAKTGHFIVIEDPLLRAAVGGEHSSRTESFSDPSTLKLLAEKTHVQLLVLGKLSPSQQGLFLNLQAISVVTGAPLTVASVEVTERGPIVMASPSPSSRPALRAGSGQAPSSSRPAFMQAERQGSAPSMTAEPSKGSKEASRKSGGPSFLNVVERPVERSDEKNVQESVTIELSDPLLALAAGDLDGDQRPEIVGMTSSEVIVYRWQHQQLVAIARIGGPRLVRYLHLDVGDINGRGYAQVVVTALSGGRNELQSFVLELQGGQLVRIADKLGYFLRVVTGPGIETPMLVGQRMGELTAFEGPIVRIAWNGERYVEGQPLALPAQVKSLYEFAPINAAGDRITEVVVVGEQRVKTYGSEGKPSWEGKEDLGDVDHLTFSYMPTPKAILAKYGLKGGTITPEEYAVEQVLPRRVLVEAAPLWGDTRTELLTFTNPKKSGVFRSELSFPPSQVVAFDRQDGTFARGWETIPLQGKVRDVAVADLNGAGRKNLIVLSAVKEKGLMAYLQDGSRGIISVFSFIR